MQKLPDGWEIWHYDDEVCWFDNSRGYPIDFWVCQWPFVPGFFVADVVIDDSDKMNPLGTTRPIAGPFRTLFQAIAAVKLIQK